MPLPIGFCAQLMTMSHLLLGVGNPMSERPREKEEPAVRETSEPADCHLGDMLQQLHSVNASKPSERGLVRQGGRCGGLGAVPWGITGGQGGLSLQSVLACPGPRLHMVSPPFHRLWMKTPVRQPEAQGPPWSDRFLSLTHLFCLHKCPLFQHLAVLPLCTRPCTGHSWLALRTAEGTDPGVRQPQGVARTIPF